MSVRWSPGCGCCCSIFEYFSDPAEALQKFRDGVTYSGGVFNGTLETGESIEVLKTIKGADLYRLFADLDVPPETPSPDLCFENLTLQTPTVGDSNSTADVTVSGLPFDSLGYTVTVELKLDYFGVESWIGGWVRSSYLTQRLWNEGDLSDGQSDVGPIDIGDAGSTQPNGLWSVYFDSPITGGTGNVNVYELRFCFTPNTVPAQAAGPQARAYPEDTEVFEFDIEVREPGGTGWTLEQRAVDVPRCRGVVTAPSYYQPRYVAQRKLYAQQTESYMEPGYFDLGYFEGESYWLAWYSQVYFYLDDTGDPLGADFLQAPAYNARVPMAVWEDELGDYEGLKGDYLGYLDGSKPSTIPLVGPWIHNELDYTVKLTNVGKKFLITELTAEKIQGVDPDDEWSCPDGPGSGKQKHLSCDPYPPICLNFNGLRLLHGVADTSAPYASFREVQDDDRVVCSGRASTWCLANPDTDPSTVQPPDDLAPRKQLISNPGTFGQIEFGAMNSSIVQTQPDTWIETITLDLKPEGVFTPFDVVNQSTPDIHYDFRWSMVRGDVNGSQAVVNASLTIWLPASLPGIQNEGDLDDVFTQATNPCDPNCFGTIDNPPRTVQEYDDELKYETYSVSDTTYALPFQILWTDVLVDLCDVEATDTIALGTPTGGQDFTVPVRWKVEGEYYGSDPGPENVVWFFQPQIPGWTGNDTSVRQFWRPRFTLETELVEWETVSVVINLKDRADQ